MMIFQKMTVLFLLMLVGYILRKKRIIDAGSIKSLIFIVLNISNPALIISSAFDANSSIKMTDLLGAFLTALIMFAALIALASAVPHIMKAKKPEYGLYKAMTVFSNIGFVGFPIIASVYGHEALLYASAFILPYNVLIYTYGIRLMKNDKSKNDRTCLRQIFNIGVIACLFSVFLYVSRISMPSFAKSTIIYLSNMIVPLSMIIIGASLADVYLPELMKDVKLLAFSAIKLLIIPIAGCLILPFVVQNEVVRGICIVMLAMPVGSMTPMIAQQYGSDYELASKYVAASTMFSVITVPIVFLFLGGVYG